MTLVCRYCEEKFELTSVPKHLLKRGYRDVCSCCRAHGNDGEHAFKAMGIQGGEGIPKSANIAIIRNPNDPNLRHALAAQRGAGFHAFLPFSPVANENPGFGSMEYSGPWVQPKKGEDK